MALALFKPMVDRFWGREGMDREFIAFARADRMARIREAKYPRDLSRALSTRTFAGSASFQSPSYVVANAT